MSEQKIKNAILDHVLENFSIEDIEDVETNAGSCYINMKNEDTYFIIIEQCEEND